MPRVVKQPQERRSELIEAAQKLFYARGYECTSVSNIVKHVGVAQGTFYHYFASKEEVLEAMAQRMFDDFAEMFAEIVHIQQLTVMEKLQRFVLEGNQWKLERRDTIMETALRLRQPGNALMILRLSEYRRKMMTPLFAHVIEQGCTEGILDVDHPIEMAAMLVAVSEGYNRELTHLLLNSDAPASDRLSKATQLTLTFNTSYRRLLAAKDQSFIFVNPAFLEPWFQD